MRGYVLIVVFIIAAILTPPDVMSQTAMAVPMYLLYEGGILFAAVLQRGSQKDAAAAQSAEAEQDRGDGDGDGGAGTDPGA